MSNSNSIMADIWRRFSLIEEESNEIVLGQKNYQTWKCFYRSLCLKKNHGCSELEVALKHICNILVTIDEGCHLMMACLFSSMAMWQDVTWFSMSTVELQWSGPYSGRLEWDERTTHLVLKSLHFFLYNFMTFRLDRWWNPYEEIMRSRVGEGR